MEWNTVNMSIIASLIFLVVVLFNFFLALAMPHDRKKRDIRQQERIQDRQE